MDYILIIPRALRYLFDIDQGVGQWFIPILAGWLFGELAKRIAKQMGFSTPFVPWGVSALTCGVFSYGLHQRWDELPQYLEIPLMMAAAPVLYWCVRALLAVLPFKWAMYITAALKGRPKVPAKP